MKALIQRVNQASVSVGDECVGEISRGLLVLLGIDRGDTAELANALLEKVLCYRVFSDDQGKMNCSVRDVGGGVLLVSQFTLSADTRKGLRPSFSSAAEPGLARELYDHCLGYLSKAHSGHIASGQFGADMQVNLTNDGPVTFLLES